jgi:hypothetical protein
VIGSDNRGHPALPLHSLPGVNSRHAQQIHHHHSGNSTRNFHAFRLSAIKTQTIEYKEGETVCEGYLAYDDATKNPRPGILVVHDWMGVAPYSKGRAEQLAQLGYVAFVADIYGKGVRPKNPQEASAEAGKYKADRVLLRRRFNAGLAQLNQEKLVKPGQVASDRLLLRRNYRHRTRAHVALMCAA